MLNIIYLLEKFLCIEIGSKIDLIYLSNTDLLAVQLKEGRSGEITTIEGPFIINMDNPKPELVIDEAFIKRTGQNVFYIHYDDVVVEYPLKIED